MPYVNIKITREGVTAEQKARLIQGRPVAGRRAGQESADHRGRHRRGGYRQLGDRRRAGHRVGRAVPERGGQPKRNAAGTFREQLVYTASNTTHQQRRYMDELSYFGIGFAALIITLACFMASRLASRKAYH
jgi:hypothetical protein